MLIRLTEKKWLKRSFALAAFIIIFLDPLKAVQHDASTDPDPKEILDKVADLMRGDSSTGKMEMIVQTAHWKRTLTVQFWSEGKDRSLLRILSPKKERGMSTLRAGSDIWNYLPKVNRVIRVPSAMMAASWMGSHFTNDDLLKNSRMADDYEVSITFRGKREGREIIEITCMAQPEVPVVWSKVVVSVTDPDHLPILIRYYDEDLQPVRTMTFSDIGLLGGRKVPKVIKVVPEYETGEYTLVKYEEITYDILLEDDFFSIRNLQR